MLRPPCAPVRMKPSPILFPPLCMASCKPIVPKLALARRHGMRSIKVFGSMARGAAGPGSDVDLLVEPEPGQSEPVRMFALGALLMDAEALLGRHVDVVTVALLHPLLRGRVLSEARDLGVIAAA